MPVHFGPSDVSVFRLSAPPSGHFTSSLIWGLHISSFLLLVIHSSIHSFLLQNILLRYFSSAQSRSDKPAPPFDVLSAESVFVRSTTATNPHRPYCTPYKPPSSSSTPPSPATDFDTDIDPDSAHVDAKRPAQRTRDATPSWRPGSATVLYTLIRPVSCTSSLHPRNLKTCPRLHTCAPYRLQLDLDHISRALKPLAPGSQP
jgi:hypothetical protein